MTLSNAIEAQRQREQIAAWDAGEARLCSEFELRPPAVELSADDRKHLEAFTRWTAAKFARRCPAKPATVACFVLDQAALGVPEQQLLAQLEAIERLHDVHSLSNPVRTATVWNALEVKVEPPRSFNKAEKAEWAKLPPPMREATARREADRDRELRRLQSRHANGAAKPVHSTKEESKCVEREMTA